MIMRAHDVKADRIVAAVIFAHKVEAKVGKVARSLAPLPEDVLEAEMGRDNVKADELIVDVLYAHDVQANSIEVGEAHVAQMKIASVSDPDE
jgi:hypothetical protein